MSRTHAPKVSRRVRRAVRADWYESPWHIAGRAVGAAVAIVVIAALAALLVVPRLLGGDSLTVLSGSMEPTFSPGDVVVVKGVDEGAVCSDIGVGDIVTFFPEPNDPALITHRVIGKTVGTFEDGTSCRLITQGDANSDVDEPISPAQVRGKFLYGVPGLGWVRQWASENTGALIAGAAALIVGGWLLSGLRRPRSTVVSIPRTAAADSGAAASTHSGATAAQQDTAPAANSSAPAHAGTTDWSPARDHELRERELELRERELELRERELAFAQERRDDWPTAFLHEATSSQRSEA
ncbi:signal peptidase I [Leucobacter chromiireducens]|uniref:signal peptidase I n=1 Tax=Leucobacter chromiireducens TaxID=283877 RepID=UPI0013DE1D4F|nr:signal peptidase I [Leucobacter chromiireducens]